jgi:hypothetical protein
MLQRLVRQLQTQCSTLRVRNTQLKMQSSLAQLEEPVCFDEDAFRQFLTTQHIGRSFEHHMSVASTMTVADAKHKSDGLRAHGTVVMAEEQTGGLGRRGRGWVSQPSGNLYFSFVWAPSPTPPLPRLIEEMFKLNLAMGVAVAKSCIAIGKPLVPTHTACAHSKRTHRHVWHGFFVTICRRETSESEVAE